MKPIDKDYPQSLASIGLTTYPTYMLEHVAAICRVQGYKFITKKQAFASNLLKPTYKMAEQNALALTHFVDIDQIDIDFIELVKVYWSKNVGPDYISNAQAIKNDPLFVVTKLPTLALLVCEYLRRLESAAKEFKQNYTSITKNPCKEVFLNVFESNSF